MLTGPQYIPDTVHQALILCHGWGSNGDDLFSLWPYLKHALPNTAFFCPNAPIDLGYGYAWFNLNSIEVPTDYSAVKKLNEAAMASLPALDTYINNIKTQFSLDNHQLILGGFSQGGLMALFSGLKNSVKGIIAMSSVPLVAQQDMHAVPVLLTHGRDDTVVPLAGLELTQSELQKIGCIPTVFISPHMGHSIDDLCIEQINDFLKKLSPCHKRS